MQINLSDRVKEAQDIIKENMQELREYEILVLSIRALAEVENNPEKFGNYDPADKEKLIAKIRKICAKHEIVLPEYVEWSSIELM